MPNPVPAIHLKVLAPLDFVSTEFSKVDGAHGR
jgi:hypothetical protein